LSDVRQSFGGHESFSREDRHRQVFRNNSVGQDSRNPTGVPGQVMVVDAGGSLRRALLGDMLAEKAAKNGWEDNCLRLCAGI